MFTNKDLLVKVAWMYYMDGKTQQEIAKELGISRIKVQRLLKRAVKEHIVRVQISQDAYNLLSYERKLVELFGLKDAVVVPVEAKLLKQELYKELAKAAASYAMWKWLPHIEILAVGIGRTLFYLPDFLQPLPRKKKLKVVSLQGALLPNIALNSNLIGQRTAQNLNGEFFGLWAPIVANTPSEVEIIRSQPYVKMALELAQQSDLRIVGIGAASHEALLRTFGFLKDREIDELLSVGAVGDILGRFFDKDGKMIEGKTNERVVSIDLKLCSKGATVGVAGGMDKVKCIFAALTGHLVDILVTDIFVAEALVGIKEGKIQLDGG